MRRFRKIFRSEAGFTLIELLVVIAVLGILAAIAVPRLTGVTEKARLSEAEVTLGTLKNAMEMYYIEHNNYNVAAEIKDDKHELCDYIDYNSLPTDWKYTITTTANGYTISMVGSGENQGLEASIDQSGEINTTH